MDELVIIALTVVAIVLIIGVSLNAIVAQQMRAKRLRREMQAAPGGGELQAIAERTAHIEDRLAVLERIATDRGQMLSDEIEALRLASRTAERESSQ